MSSIQGMLTMNMQTEESKTPFQSPFNLDDILAEEELVPVVFKVPARNLGEL